MRTTRAACCPTSSCGSNEETRRSRLPRTRSAGSCSRPSVPPLKAWLDTLDDPRPRGCSTPVPRADRGRCVHARVRAGGGRAPMSLSRRGGRAPPGADPAGHGQPPRERDGCGRAPARLSRTVRRRVRALRPRARAGEPGGADPRSRGRAEPAVALAYGHRAGRSDRSGRSIRGRASCGTAASGAGCARHEGPGRSERGRDRVAGAREASSLPATCLRCHRGRGDGRGGDVRARVAVEAHPDVVRCDSR